MTDESDFLRRWSRRKRAARKPGPSDTEPVEDAREPSAGDEIAAARGEEPESAESPTAEPESLELPDIDSLNADSDFTPFLKKGVPEELKNRALRKLWRVNPVFGHLDGLNDYDGDFTDAATVVKDLKTLYKVGRGFLPDPEDTATEPAPESPSDGGEGEASGAIDEALEPDTEERRDDGANGNKIS